MNWPLFQGEQALALNAPMSTEVKNKLCVCVQERKRIGGKRETRTDRKLSGNKPLLVTDDLFFERLQSDFLNWTL